MEKHRPEEPMTAPQYHYVVNGPMKRSKRPPTQAQLTQACKVLTRRCAAHGDIVWCHLPIPRGVMFFVPPRGYSHCRVIAQYSLGEDGHDEGYVWQVDAAFNQKVLSA